MENLLQAPHQNLLALIDFLREQGVSKLDAFAAEIEGAFACHKCKDTKKLLSGEFGNEQDVDCECDE